MNTIKNKFKIRIFLFKNMFVEHIKYKSNFLKFPLTLLFFLVSKLCLAFDKNNLALKISSYPFRLNWPGSYFLAGKLAHQFLSSPRKPALRLIKELIDLAVPLPHTQKFFDDPNTLLEGVVICIKSPSEFDKGIIIIKYSYYFPLMFKLFDMHALSSRYRIILEPSWAGYFEPSILSYTALSVPVYVMAPEARDHRFIKELDSNLIPVSIGPNWWVNDEEFKAPLSSIRDIDILIVAGWAQFKRHYSLFKNIKKLRDIGKKYSVVCAGYPGDLNLTEIKKLAHYYGISDQVEFFEWLDPSQMVSMYQRSKVNLLWSFFEGSNRAIIEGMFCDTPCILKQGHNYGEHYDFINKETGSFCNEHELPERISSIIEGQYNYTPRKYVLKNRSCTLATEALSKKIADVRHKQTNPSQRDDSKVQ